MASFTSFFHGDRTHFADHNPLFGHFSVGVASLVVYRSRNYGDHPVDAAYEPLSGRIDKIHHMFSLACVYNVVAIVNDNALSNMVVGLCVLIRNPCGHLGPESVR